jgi:hypothetical protein
MALSNGWRGLDFVGCARASAGERMYRRRGLLRGICLALALIGTRAAQAQMTDLIATLSADLGLTREQATGGAGAVFRLAQQRLSPAVFSMITESVPGVERVLAVAPAVGETGAGIDDLALPFSLLGMSPRLIPAFLQIVVDFVQATGSDPIAGLLRRTIFGP